MAAFHFHADFFLGAGNSGDGKADPSVLAVFQDYIKLMPLVAEANQMSEELKKVRARKWSDVRSGKDLEEQGQPHSLPLPQAGFMVQMEAQRPGKGRCFARDTPVSP